MDRKARVDNRHTNFMDDKFYHKIIDLTIIANPLNELIIIYNQ